jgi:hypothetical protein
MKDAFEKKILLFNAKTKKAKPLMDLLVFLFLVTDVCGLWWHVSVDFWLLLSKFGWFCQTMPFITCPF